MPDDEPLTKKTLTDAPSGGTFQQREKVKPMARTAREPSQAVVLFNTTHGGFSCTKADGKSVVFEPKGRVTMAESDFTGEIRARVARGDLLIEEPSSRATE